MVAEVMTITWGEELLIKAKEESDVCIGGWEESSVGFAVVAVAWMESIEKKKRESFNVFRALILS
jgi:hypothetical protein